MSLSPKTDLTLNRRLRAPVSALWACWTTPELIKAFFVPEPHSVTACEIDLRPGGRFNTTFLVDGNEIENTGVFLEIVPQERLVFTDTYSEGWTPAPEPFMTAIIEFAPLSANQTDYTATLRHRTEEARKTHEDMGFYEGWGAVASQLERLAQSL